VESLLPELDEELGRRFEAGAGLDGRSAMTWMCWRRTIAGWGLEGDEPEEAESVGWKTDCGGSAENAAGRRVDKYSTGHLQLGRGENGFGRMEAGNAQGENWKRRHGAIAGDGDEGVVGERREGAQVTRLALKLYRELGRFEGGRTVFGQAIPQRDGGRSRLHGIGAGVACEVAGEGFAGNSCGRVPLRWGGTEPEWDFDGAAW